MFLIKDGEPIPEWLAKLVYKGYIEVYGGSMGSYEEIRSRGGFTKAEVAWALQFLDIETPEDARQIIEESENIKGSIYYGG